jgi:glycosyltransferase involved in cell wall biosynthesis
MNKEIIILTNEFPFGKRETFVESEIEVISKVYNKIIVVPSKKCNSVRKLPSNVIVDLTVCNQYKGWFWIIKAVISPFFLKTVFKYVKVFRNKKQIIYLFKYITSFTIHYNIYPKLITKYNPDLIYSYWFNSSVDALAFLLRKNKYHFKVVCRAHRIDLYEEISPLKFFPYRKEVLSIVNKIFPISEDGKFYLENKYNASNVSVSKLGVLDNNILCKPSLPDFISIVSVSNIIPVKNVSLIAKVITELSYLYDDKKICWNHFGSGDGQYEIIQFLKNSAGKNLSYKFHGTVPNQEIFNFYLLNSVDLFINLSESEGIPVSIMEAISAGIPIIATNVGGTSEIVNKVTGILLPAKPSLKEIIDSINTIVKNNFDRNKIKKYWSNNYNAEKNYLDFVSNINGNKV